MKLYRMLWGAIVAPVLASCAVAQESGDAPGMRRVPVQADAGAIALYDGAAPGSEGATYDEVWTHNGSERWARNITHPTLLPVLPEAGEATGAAVIVVPGGGFQFVSMDNEGYPIAEWLAARGVAAFILKYRVMQTPDAEADFAEVMRRLFSPAPGDERVDTRKGIPFAVADAQAALRLVESRSAEWGVDTDRIGMLGFSAGAMTTLGVTLAEGDAPRADFIGYIYGPMTAVDIPEDAPPMFAALAADDGLFGAQGFGVVEAWRKAEAPVELHFYERGGHGFGSYRRGVTADGWFDQFVNWMSARGLLQDQ